MVGWHEVVERGGGDVGSVIAVQAAMPLFDRGAPGTGRARRRVPLRRQARLEAFRDRLRGRHRGGARGRVERRDAAERYRASASTNSGEVERIAQVSYDAGERGILELLDAYRTSSSARMRQAALDVAVRQAEIELEFVSGWEIPMSERRNQVRRAWSASCRACWRRATANRQRRRRRAADARRDELDRQERAVHGVSAARHRPDGSFRRASDAAADFAPVNAGRPAHRDDARSGRQRR